MQENERQKSHCLVNSANEIMQFQNGSNKVAIKLRAILT